jgi:hypothetical protein
MSAILLRMTGFILLIAIPKRNHHRDNLLNPNNSIGEEKETPLSVRMVFFLQNILKWEIILVKNCIRSV